jgi:hypothetical protein
MIGRRSFLRTLSVSLLAAPLAAEARQTGTVPRLGVLSPSSPSAFGYEPLQLLSPAEPGELPIECADR